MAETSATPALPSTADATPYVPVSWMAVGAAAVAGLFVVVLLALGISAFMAKKPLVQLELLAFPAIGIVLSFAARRVIRNSEGTRTGERLAAAAWWTCLIGGLGYAAYLFAIDYAVRRDATGELTRWINNIVDGDEKNLNAAFLRTREPARRSGISPENTKEIYGLFPDEALGFAHCDLVRLARRNRGNCQLMPGGLKDWMYRPGGIDCLYSGSIKCPEGTFPFVVGLRGTENTSSAEGIGRQWTVMFPVGGFLTKDQRSLTPYGWMLESLEGSGTSYGAQFIGLASAGPLGPPAAYHTMIGPESKAGFWNSFVESANAHMAVAGSLALALPLTPDYHSFFAKQFYAGTEGTAASPEQIAQFRKIWEASGLVPPGARIRNNKDVQAILSLTDTAVELRMPCELPLTGADSGTAARARLVIVCTDPAVLAEVKRLRAEANPDKGTSAFPEEFRRRKFKWQIVKLESDLAPVRLPQQQSPGGPGGPPGGMTAPMGGQ